MDGKLDDVTLAHFLQELASDSPAPGGGTASALAGALAAALVAMVARLSLGREVTAPRAELERLLAEAERERQSLLELAAADAEAYRGVLAAYRLPRSTAEEKDRRREAVEQALRRAAEVPLEVASIAARVLSAAEFLGREGYPAAATDAGVAERLARAAAAGALANVEVNLESMRDAGTVAALREEVRGLASRCQVD